MSNTLSSSSVRSQSRRSGLSWNTVERKIRKPHRASLGEITEEDSRRLYSLGPFASRHAGTSPRRLLEKAKGILR